MSETTSAASSITLPYRFDTSTVWRTILKGALGLNALFILCAAVSALTRPWPMALALALVELFFLWFTRLLFRFQEGSVGTLDRDGVEVEPNVLLGLPLPGPRGRYALDRFAAVRIEFRSGPIQPGVQGGPNEVIWLAGRPGTPDVAVARTSAGAGREVGRQLAGLLGLPAEEAGAPRRISL